MRGNRQYKVVLVGVESSEASPVDAESEAMLFGIESEAPLIGVDPDVIGSRTTMAAAKLNLLRRMQT
jgi:hypothetical protein